MKFVREMTFSSVAKLRHVAGYLFSLLNCLKDSDKSLGLYFNQMYFPGQKSCSASMFTTCCILSFVNLGLRIYLLWTASMPKNIQKPQQVNVQKGKFAANESYLSCNTESYVAPMLKIELRSCLVPTNVHNYESLCSSHAWAAIPLPPWKQWRIMRRCLR